VTDLPAGAEAAAVVSAAALGAVTREVFARAGMPEDHAALVADALVWADLRGMDTHGVTRVPWYLDLMARGDINPTPTLTARAETAAAVLLDADRAAGPVAMTAAMRAAVTQARGAGVGLALVRSTTHTAALGYYTRMATTEGMAALAMTASTPLMAYHGALAPSVGTNPISIAVPGGGGPPLILDMATSVASMGKLTHARRAGQPIPVGWALDARGRPTTDPRAADLPLPLGGPKGAGLSLMIECLTSLVAGNPVLADALGAPAGHRRHRQNALALAIDVARFGDPAAFRAEVRRLVAALKALPHDPGVEILVPGERGHRTLEQRARDGIPLPRAVYEALARAAERLGVAMPAAR